MPSNGCKIRNYKFETYIEPIIEIRKWFSNDCLSKSDRILSPFTSTNTTSPKPAAICLFNIYQLLGWAVLSPSLFCNPGEWTDDFPTEVPGCISVSDSPPEINLDEPKQHFGTNCQNLSWYYSWNFPYFSSPFGNFWRHCYELNPLWLVCFKSKMRMGSWNQHVLSGLLCTLPICNLFWKSKSNTGIGLTLWLPILSLLPGQHFLPDDKQPGFKTNDILSVGCWWV